MNKVSAPLLDVRNLSVEIASTTIVDRLRLQLQRGAVHGLAGESGSGKSMTALAVMGLLPDSASATGSVLLGGHDLMSSDDAGMCDIRGRRMGMIFQEPMTALNPLMTIGDQVAETVRIHTSTGRDEARAIAASRLDRVGITADRAGLGRFPHELSGGQRQRVMIAQAIALQPALLIADEPTTALDVTTQASILDLLCGLAEEEAMAMLLITHDLAVLARHAARISVMESGRIVEEAESEALFRNRTHGYTRKLISAATHQPARVARSQHAKSLLTVEQVRVGYRTSGAALFTDNATRMIVKDVSLSVAAGESVALVGESGCGKSTLARAILGLEPLIGGSVTLDGHQISQSGGLPESAQRAVRGAMQVVFQDPFGSFNPRHRVARLVAEPFHALPHPPRGRDLGDAVADALLSVGLQTEDGTKFIHEFSGGQRQRIAIARALVTRPKLIILDEAVSALDVSIRAQVLDLLAELRAKHNLSYLFITHDLAVVRAIADRVVVMKEGRFVETGPTDQVLDHPSAGYTRELVAASLEIPPEWLA